MKELEPGKKRTLEIVLAAALFVLLAAWALGLALTDIDREVSSSKKRMFARAVVDEITYDDASPDAWTEGLRIGKQYVCLQLRSGEHRGEYVEGMNYLSAYSNVDCNPGTHVIVRLDYDDDGNIYLVSIPSYDRSAMLIVLCASFALLLVIIGRKKGLMALAGLIYTMAAIWYLLVPMLLRGADPVGCAILIVALTTLASLLLLTGLTKKTLCATLGCVGGVAAAGLFSAVAAGISPIGGFNMPAAEELVLRMGEYDLHISGLLTAGILIASLGAVMDVAMSIASSCSELYAHDRSLKRRELFRSGMNIGRDAMGTMANTLILAFAGASLNTLLLVQLYDYPLIQLFNADAIIIEIIRGISGSIGIILTVPLVAALSSWLLPKKR